MKFSIQDFNKEFPDDDACLDRIFQMKFGDLDTCPKCETKTKFHRVSERRQYACQNCGHQIAPCVGTPFEKSSTSLQKWFYAMYLFTSSEHGVPAKELERQLSVTYKTAWRMGHELRKLLGNINGDGDQTLDGHVEMDETFIGGKAKAKPGAAEKYKATVLGILQRDGRVKTRLIKGRGRKHIEPMLTKYVPWGTTVSTDEAGDMMFVSMLPYEHGRVNHRRKEWKRGIHHTNGIEGYWSRLKCSIKGTHVHVSEKHLQKYTEEFSFRYDNRKVGHAAMFDCALSGIVLRHPKAD